MKGFQPKSIAVLAIAAMSLVLVGCTTATPMPTFTPPPKTVPPPPATLPATQPAPATKSPEVKTWQLRFAYEQDVNNPVSLYGHQPWLDDIESVTSGRVKVTVFPSQTLMRSANSWEGVQSGVADMVHVSPAYYPGAFDILDSISLPYIATNAEVASLAAWTLYQKYPEIQAQMKDAKVLTVWASEPGFFLTRSKQVKTLEDFKGLRLSATAGPPTTMIKLLGAVPVVSSSDDIYSKLMNGDLDGVVASAEDILDYKLYEAARYYTYVPTAGGWFFEAINWETWNSFTPDIQQAFSNACGKRLSVRYGGEVYDRARAELKETVKKAGYDIVEFTPSKGEVDRWVIVSGKPLWGDWVKMMEARGVKNARQIVEDYLGLVDKFSKERTLVPVSKTMPLR